MNKFILILILFLFMDSDAYADKAVKQKSTGRLIYKQSPDFETGKGILCAKAMGFAEADLEEISITQAEWDAELSTRANEKRDAELNKADLVATIKWMREELNVIRAALPVPLPALTLAGIKTKITGYYP